MLIARAIVLAAVALLEIARAVRKVRSAAGSVPPLNPPRLKGQYVGIATRLAVSLGLVATTFQGSNLATAVLAMGIAVGSLRIARDFAMGLVEGFAPDAPHVPRIATGIATAISLVLFAGGPIWVLTTTDPDLPVSIVYAFVGVGLLASIGLRTLRTYLPALPRLWHAESMSNMPAYVRLLLERDEGAVLSVAHEGKKVVGFERAENGCIHFILWNDNRAYEELSIAVREIESSGFLVALGQAVPSDQPREHGRVVLCGDWDEVSATATRLADISRSALQIADDAKLDFALSGSYDMDMAIHRQRAADATKATSSRRNVSAIEPQLTGWIQHVDLSVDELGPVDHTRARQLLVDHPWHDELARLEKLEEDGLDCCPPGLGMINASGPILHLCPLPHDRLMVHYHYPARRGIAKWLRSQQTHTLVDVPRAIGHRLIDDFCRADHDDLMVELRRAERDREGQ